MRARRIQTASMVERVPILFSSLNRWIRIELRLENGNLGIRGLKKRLGLREMRVLQEIGKAFLRREEEKEMEIWKMEGDVRKRRRDTGSMKCIVSALVSPLEVLVVVVVWLKTNSISRGTTGICDPKSHRL